MNAEREAAKLGHKEPWNLAGSGGVLRSRTRLKGKSSSRCGDASKSSDESSYSAGSESDDTESGEEDVTIMDKAAPRAIVEVEPLQDLVERNCKCQECGSVVQLLHDTVTLATRFRIVCANEK